jgi:RNA-directed DNA polymerase
MTDWKNAVETEANKLIARFETYARQLSDERRRRARRTTEPVSDLVLRRPEYWNVADGFDPYLVRARAARIGHAIQRKISAREYSPLNPVTHEIPKRGGGSRSLSVFQIADNAVSKHLFRGLMEKNRSLLSSRAYAYRDDISVQDALHYVAGDLRGESRVFVAEYDFSGYFDNIQHEHLWRTLIDRRFLITKSEQELLKGFLKALPHSTLEYSPTCVEKRTTGIPQGTSISLFMANVAAWDLDRAFERLGISFARFADDTLVWSRDYAQICRAADTIHEMAERIGAPLNLKKSGGIRLLTKVGSPAEMSAVHYVEYLSHSIALTSVSIKSKVVQGLKSHILKLLYFHLVREPLRRTQASGRLTGIDRDYVTYVWQLRRYLYGGLSELKVRRMLRRGAPLQRFRGFVAFFPLVDDTVQLNAIDAWVRRQTHLALRKRAALLQAYGNFSNLPPPHGLPCSKLRTLRHVSQTTSGSVDLRLPSLFRMSMVIRAAAKRYGATRVARGSSFEYRRQNA